MKKDAEDFLDRKPYILLILVITILTFIYKNESHTVYETFIYSLRTTASSCFLISFFLLFIIIENVIKKNFVFFTKGFVVPAAVIILLGCFNIPLFFGIGTTTQIGHFYEKSEYTEDYLVLVSDEPFGTPGRVIQEMKCEIWRSRETTGYNTITNVVTAETQEVEESELMYHITTLYLPNGSCIYFNNELSNVLKPGGEYVVTDEYDNDYYITLTTHRWKDTQYNKKGD